MAEESRSIQIRGGAGPHEAAAIAVVVGHVLAHEQAGTSQSPPRSRLNAWVISARRPPLRRPRQPATRLTREVTEV